MITSIEVVVCFWITAGEDALLYTCVELQDEQVFLNPEKHFDFSYTGVLRSAKAYLHHSFVYHASYLPCS